MAISVRAGVLDTVMVATHPLRVGTAICPGDIRPQAVVSWGRPASCRAAPGWEVLRSLAAGEIVAWPAAAAPLLVERGEPVRFEWMRGGVRITVAAVALHSARLGESVRARVPGRRETLVGIVTGPRLAKLTEEKGS